MQSVLLFPQPSTVQTPQGQAYEGRSFSGKGVGLIAVFSVSQTISLLFFLFISLSLLVCLSLSMCFLVCRYYISNNPLYAGFISVGVNILPFVNCNPCLSCFDTVCCTLTTSIYL